MTSQRRTRADLLGDSEPPRSHNGSKGDGGRSANPHRDALYIQQARIAQLKADQLAGMLVLATDVEREWASIVTDVRQQLLAIPARLGATLGLPVKQVEAIDAEIRAVASTLAATGGRSDARRTESA